MRWLYVLTIGLGFFTTGVSWGVYNSYLPKDFLPVFITGDFQMTIIGAIMVLDNIFAFFLQPYIGARSDRTWTRWGRRMPYIMVGVPIASVTFVLIAYGWAMASFWFMMAALTVFNVSMAFYRAPVVALMPDLVGPEHRSKANGVINLMGGIGAVYAFAIASRIYKINDPVIGAMLGVTAEQSGPVLTFLTTAIIMVVALVLLFVFIKEPATPLPAEIKREMGIVEALRQVSLSRDRSAMLLLLAIFFWFLSYNAIETWFTTYGANVLGFATADASFLLNGIAISFIVFAVPAGYLAGRIGRKKTIAIGLVLMLVALVLLIPATDYVVILGLLAIAGTGWAFVNVNSIVMVWQLLGQSRLGAGTGLYYGFSMSAAILGPFITGIIFDAAALLMSIQGVTLLFPVSLVFLVIALLLTLSVRTGEVGDVAIVSE